MKALFFSIVLFLSGCVTHPSPSRCEAVIRSTTSLEQLISALINILHVSASQATGFAEGLMTGQLSISTVCQAIH